MEQGNQDNIRTLYDALKDKYNLGSEEDFSESLKTPENRKTLYDAISGEYELGSEDDFNSSLGYGIQPVQGSNNPAQVKHYSLKELAGKVPADIDDISPNWTGDRNDAEYVLAKRMQSIRDAYRKGELDFGIPEEEKRLDKQYKPKQVSSRQDVFENYRNRFALTKRGEELNNEYAAIQQETVGRYSDEFRDTPEYKAMAGKTYKTEEEAVEANRKLQELFIEKYGDLIKKDMQPYADALDKEVLRRYGSRINDEQTGLAKENISKYLRESLANIDKELDTPRESLPMHSVQALFIPSTVAAAAQRYGNAQTKERQDRYTALVAARNFLDDANKIVEEAGKKGKTNFVSGALRGLRDGVFDPNTWLMGISEFSYYNLLRQAAEKAESGGQLSSEEQQLLDAAAVNMAVNAYFSSDLGRGYKAGNVTAESIPFMLQFALNPVSAAGKGIAKAILKHGMKRFGLNTAKRTVSGSVAHAAARIAGDAAAAAGLTATTGIGNVAADAEQRMTGNVRFREDEDGGIRYDGREGAVGTGEAIARAFASTFFENQSEMVGIYFAPVMAGVSGLVNHLPGVKQLSASKTGEIYRSIKNNPTYREFTNRTQWHGAIGEYAEEVYNNLASVAMGDMTTEELVDLDNNIDTFLGVGLMSAVFGGIGAAGFTRDRYTLNRAIRRFESTLSPEEMERWSEVKRVAQNGDVEGVREFVKYTMRDNELTAQEKKDEIEYIFNVMRQAAMENVAAEQTEESVRAETEDIISNSDTQTNTYTECNRIVMNDIGEQVEVPGHIVGYMGGQPLWKPDGATADTEAIPLKEGEYNPESIKSMPTQEVIDETAAAIREDAAVLAQRESTYSPDIVPYNQLEPGKSSFYDKDGNLYEVGLLYIDSKNFMMLVTSPDGKQIASRPFSEEEYLSICQAQIDAQEATQSEYSLNTEITLRDEAGNTVRGSITAEKNEDGLYEVQTESPINGRSVNLFTREELDRLRVDRPDDGQPPLGGAAAVVEERQDGNNVPQNIPENGNIGTENIPQPQQSAMERIPKDEKGEPIYEQADPDTAWDAIVEQTKGDEAMAQSVADSMVADKEAELKKAEKAKPKGGTTVAEKIAAERERKNIVEQAKANLAHWQRIAQTSQIRRQAAALEQSKQVEEAARLRREQEERERAEREEAGERVRLSDEVDENGIPFVVSENGTTTFGEIREDSGLTPAPIKLSEGYQDENGKGYGLIHIETNHGSQIKNAGFKSVEDFVYYVAENYDEDNIRVGKRRENGSPTFLIQVTDTHDNTLFIEMSKDGSYWNVNSAGIFRKGYSNKKETVAKTEPQQPNNAVSTGSSLSEDEGGGITSSEPNGEPTVSNSKDSEKSRINNKLSEK